MITFNTSGAGLNAFSEAPPRATKAAANNKIATPSAWDDDESASQLVTNPASDVGQFTRTLLGHSSRATGRPVPFVIMHDCG
jgi:hypothetical protein